MPPDINALVPFEGARSSDDAALPTRIQQLVKQKGTFRSVTEASLLDEIRDASADVGHDDDMATGSDEEKPAETRQATLDRLYQARMEELHRLGFMAYRMSTFVDAFAMSLTSKSRVAENAISKPTRNAVPPSSLTGHKVTQRVGNKAAIRRSDEISLAARIETFTNAAKHLDGASKRLRLEADKQANFWAELAEMRSKGWQVSRAPTNNKAFVVHIGSHESSPQYASKGTAILRQDDDGSLTFDGADSPESRKVLSVRIIRNSNVTGQCYLRKEFETSTPLEAKLVQARESLFQDELFAEACKEARGLANMGVGVRDGVIEARLSPDVLVQVQYSKSATPSIENSQEDSHLAEYICAQLRLMLVAEHQQRNIQRTQHKPAPMSMQTRSDSDYVLLRPIISQLRHQLAVSPVLRSLRSYETALRGMGLKMAIKHDLSTENQSSNAKLSELRRMVISTLVIQLPSGRSMKLVAETHLAAPHFGTQWNHARLQDEKCGTTIFSQTPSSMDTIRSIEDALARDISLSVMKNPHRTATWEIESTYPIRLKLEENGTTLLGLVVSCSAGKVALCIVGNSKRSKDQVEWNDGTMRRAGEASERQTTLEQYLADVLSDI